MNGINHVLARCKTASLDTAYSPCPKYFHREGAISLANHLGSEDVRGSKWTRWDRWILFGFAVRQVMEERLHDPRPRVTLPSCLSWT